MPADQASRRSPSSNPTHRVAKHSQSGTRKKVLIVALNVGGWAEGGLQRCALSVGCHEVTDTLLIALGLEAVQQLDGDRGAVGRGGHRG